MFKFYKYVSGLESLKPGDFRMVGILVTLGPILAWLFDIFATCEVWLKETTGIPRCAFVLSQALPDETLYQDNACYGSDTNSYFNASCNSNHAIAVSKVLGGAKPSTTGCPPATDWNNTVNFNLCCNFTQGDCIEEFSGALKTYHDGCSGEQACKYGTGATRYRFSNCSQPLVNNSYNSYMQLYYYCIDETAIGSTCTSVNMTMSGKALYLWNSGYPLSATSDCNCSIEVDSSNAQIEVMALRIELIGGSSNCIRFSDGVCEMKETVLCSNVSTITHSFTSTSSYLLMEYIKGQINGSGRYWIRFKATNSSANIIVKCQPETKPMVCTTTSTTTTTTPSTTTTTKTTDTTTTMTNSTNTTTASTTTLNTTQSNSTTTPVANVPGADPLKLNEEKSPTSAVIGGVAGGVCFVLLFGVIVIIYWKVIKPARDRKATDLKKGRGRQDAETADSKQESTNENAVIPTIPGGIHSVPPANTQFRPRYKANTFGEGRDEDCQQTDAIETQQNIQNTVSSSMLTNGNVLIDLQNVNGTGEGIKKKSRKKKMRKLVNEANESTGDTATENGEKMDDSGISLLAAQGLLQNDGRSKKHKKRKKRKQQHRNREDDPELKKQSQWYRGIEGNGMPYDDTLIKFEPYIENGEGTKREKKSKKRKGKKRSAGDDDVDDQDLEQNKEERHHFEIKVHPEHLGEQNVKEKKEKNKKKKKKHMEEEEGKEMKEGKKKIKQRDKHMEEKEGVQSGDEMRRERKKKKHREEEEEIQNGGEVKVEKKKKRKHREEEDGVQSGEEIREERNKKNKWHSEDGVQNGEETKEKRKKKKKRQRHQKEEREDEND